MVTRPYNRIILTEFPEDIFREILLNLNDRDLANVCMINKRAENIGNDDQFWNLRIQKVYGANLSEYKNDKTYKELIERGEDINEVLIQASALGYLPVVEYLVEIGANIHIYTEYALISASARGQLSMVQYLVEQGAYIHARDDGALIAAAAHGNLSVVTYLIEEGADMHADDDDTIISASREGHLLIVKYLIERESGSHIWHNESLVVASRKGHLSIVKYLIEEGGNRCAC